MRFGEKLRIYRMKKGLSQQELSKLAGLGINTIGNYEVGRTYPKSHDVYKRLADILDVDANYLHNENEDFGVVTSRDRAYPGHKEDMVDDVYAYFTSSETTESEMDEFLKSVLNAYWIAKDRKRRHASYNYNK
jgi:transcriptional regulator with XRE-family HTH domain